MVKVDEVQRLNFNLNDNKFLSTADTLVKAHDGVLIHFHTIKYGTRKRVIDKQHNIVLPFGEIIFYNEHQHKNRTYVSSFCLPNTKRQIQNFEENFLGRLRTMYGKNNTRDNNPYKCFMK